MKWFLLVLVVSALFTLILPLFDVALTFLTIALVILTSPLLAFILSSPPAVESKNLASVSADIVAVEPIVDSPIAASAFADFTVAFPSTVDFQIEALPFSAVTVALPLTVEVLTDAMLPAAAVKLPLTVVLLFTVALSDNCVACCYISIS